MTAHFLSPSPFLSLLPLSDGQLSLLSFFIFVIISLTENEYSRFGLSLSVFGLVILKIPTSRLFGQPREIAFISFRRRKLAFKINLRCLRCRSRRRCSRRI